MITTKIEQYWEQFLNTTALSNVDYFDVYSDGNGKRQADKLAKLIANGVKTTTSSAVGLYAPNNEDVPKVGDYNVILDGSESPICITRTESIETIAFDQVSAENAHQDGDRSLRHWKRTHLNLFKREYAKIGQRFNPQMPCLFERFKVVYK